MSRAIPPLPLRLQGLLYSCFTLFGFDLKLLLGNVEFYGQDFDLRC
jgi:hypothetical protein